MPRDCEGAAADWRAATTLRSAAAASTCGAEAPSPVRAPVPRWRVVAWAAPGTSEEEPKPFSEWIEDAPGELATAPPVACAPAAPVTDPSPDEEAVVAPPPADPPPPLAPPAPGAEPLPPP